MNLEFFSQNPELLWIFTVFYDLTLAIILFYFFGKNGLYTAVILGIILANLQGGKVSELSIFGNTFVVSMGAIMYSGIYFATDLLNEKYDSDLKHVRDNILADINQFLYLLTFNK